MKYAGAPAAMAADTYRELYGSSKKGAITRYPAARVIRKGMTMKT